MDVEARLLLYTVALGAAAGLVQLLRRRAFAFGVYMAELVALLGLSIAGVVLPGWTLELAWPVFGAFAAVAMAPPALLAAARRLARGRRYRLAHAAAAAGSALLGLPAPLRRESALYAALAAADSGDAERCRERLEGAQRVGGIPAELGGPTLVRALTEAAARRWEETLAAIDAAPSRAPTILALEARAAAETGDLARAIRASRLLDSMGAPLAVRASARRAVLAAAGRARFLEDAAARRLPVADGPRGTADLAVARAREARGQAALAVEAYERAASRGRGVIAIDAALGRERVARNAMRLAPSDADADALAEIEAVSAAERRLPETRPLLVRAPLTAAVSAALVAVGVAAIVALGRDSVSLLSAGALSARLVAQGEWWRLLAATFLHGGWVHLAMNVSALLVVGAPYESRTGPARTAIVYVASGLAASAASAGLAGTEVGVGASGAVMGLVGALGALVLLRPALFEPAERRRWLVVIGLTVAATAALGVLEHESLDNAAHGAGLVAGLLLGASIVPRGDALWAARVRRALGASLCGLLAASAVIAGLRMGDWRGERVVRAGGVRAALPAWLRVREIGGGLLRAERPPLEFVVLLGARPTTGSRELLLFPGEAGHESEAPQRFRIRSFRRGAAFAMVRVPAGDDEAALDDAALRIGASLEAVE